MLLFLLLTVKQDLVGSIKELFYIFEKSVDTSYNGILIFQTLNFPNLKLPDFFFKVIIPLSGSLQTIQIPLHSMMCFLPLFRLLCRLTYALCLNFLAVIHLDGHVTGAVEKVETSFTKVKILICLYLVRSVINTILGIRTLF